MKSIFVLALLLASSAAAQIPTPQRPVSNPKDLVSPADPQARPVPIDDLIYTRGVFSAAWSADGRQLFLSTNLTDRYNIWRTSADGSWPVQLTHSEETQRELIPAPDGRTLYFLQDRGGNERYDLFAVPTAGGEPVNLTNTPDVQESAPLISRDGRWMAVSTKRGDQGQIDLAVVDLASGKVRQLTHEADQQWGWYPVAWVDGGRSLIANHVFVDFSVSEVWKVDVASGKAVKLIGKPGVLYLASDATADGSKIALTTNETTHQSHAAVFEPASGAIRKLRPTVWEQTSGPISPDGRLMVVTTSDNARKSLELVELASLAEKPVQMAPGVNGTMGLQPFSPDSRRMLVYHGGADSPGDVKTLDIATGAVTTTVPLTMASLDPRHLPKSEVVTFPSFDGTLISAVVTMPFNLKRDGSNPAVVIPHGGPTSQAVDEFISAAAALASRGYVVIRPNPRGSTGYGLTFRKANFQDLGGGDLKDELAAKQFLVDTGYVDPDRVGITGGSYGGFMTLMAIGRAPEAFAAAVEQYGIIDWRTMWEHEDPLLQAYQKSLLGTPEDAPKVYDASSPLTYIQQVKAPLLVLQGENDIRVPVGQAKQVAAALKARGNIVDAVIYPEEGHGFFKREHQRDALQRTIDWFDKYLKRAPGGATSAR